MMFHPKLNMKCTRNLQLLMTFYVSGGYLLVVALLIFAIALLLALRKSFHPFFLMFFLPFLVFYALCLFCYVVIDLSHLFDLSEFLPSTATTIVILTYRSNTPLIISFLLERLYATKYCGIYEIARPWCLFFPLLPLAVLIAAIDLYLLEKGLISPSVEQYSLLALEIVIFVLLCALHFVNKRLVARSTYRGLGLSPRYQLTENIRVLRLIIPVIIWDGAITSEDLLAQLHFGINHEFNLRRCNHEPAYFSLFVVLNTIALLLISCVPLSVLLAHPGVKNLARERICCWRAVATTKKKSIVNVLGQNLKQTTTTQEHFNNLRQLWK